MWLRRLRPAPVMMVAVALAVACEALVLLRDVEQWRRSQLSALGFHANAATLVAPIAAAAAASLAGLVGRSLLGTIALVARRPVAAAARIAATVTAPLVLVHLGGGVVAVLVARSWGLEGTPPVGRWVPGAGAIVAGAAAGTLLGWRGRPVLAAPLAAVACFGVLGFVGPALPSDVLDVASGPDVLNQAVRPSWVAASAAAWALLSLAALVGVRPRGALLAAGPTAAALVLVVAGPRTSLEPDRALVCAGRAPTVCASPERRPQLADSRRAIVRIGRALDRVAGRTIPLPARFSELGGAGMLSVSDPGDRESLVSDVIDAVMRCSGGGTPAPPLVLAVADAAFGPGTLSPASLDYQPAPSHLTAAALRGDARRAAERLRGCS